MFRDLARSLMWKFLILKVRNINRRFFCDVNNDMSALIELLNRDDIAKIVLRETGRTEDKKLLFLLARDLEKFAGEACEKLCHVLSLIKYRRNSF